MEEKCKYDLALFISHRLVCLDEIVEKYSQQLTEDDIIAIYKYVREGDIDSAFRYIEDKLNIRVVFIPNNHW